MFRVSWIRVVPGDGGVPRYVKSEQSFGGFAKALSCFLRRLEDKTIISVEIEADKRQDLKQRGEKVAADA